MKNISEYGSNNYGIGKNAIKNQVDIEDFEMIDFRELEEIDVLDESHRAKEKEESNRAKRKKRMEEMRREKKRQELMRRFFPLCLIVFAVCAIFVSFGVRWIVKRHKVRTKSEEVYYDISSNIASCSVPDVLITRMESDFAYANTLVDHTLGGRGGALLFAEADAETILFSEDIVSENGILIDVEAGKILAQKDAKARISPASMTKVLTILVAAEHLTEENLDDSMEITVDILDYGYIHKCSGAGFERNEQVSVRDLFYGTILPSGAEAAVGLAQYVSGSQETFVELMNEKIDELGLSETTHFTNCVGVYDENHYSTTYDIAVILNAAYKNDFCREVLSAHTYTTSVTEQHLEGISMSNIFLRRIEDKDTHGEVLCAKTGYVVESGNCAASLSIGNDGKEYICVTAHSSSTNQCISDHANLYQQFLP